MYKTRTILYILFTCFTMTALGQHTVQIFETSASGNKLKQLSPSTPVTGMVRVRLKPAETFQTITGFGGSFTESSAYLLGQLSKNNRKKILEAYFSAEG
ncbi:MAG TPA: hypothetical protein PKC51_04860, partial [Ferruginibacter sp.]|nr:hypothetical protein [Ferruginibacter sp.]